MRFNSLKTLIFLMLSMVTGLAPTLAYADAHDILGLGGVTPVGLWEADDKSSRYQATLCGDGTQLCAKLVWIKPQMINERNGKFIGTYIVYELTRARPAEWRGNVTLEGSDISGSVKILNPDLLLITACIFFILCDSITLFRIENLDAPPA